jgi:uncharacterized protein
MDIEQIRQLTLAYGEGWGYAHVRRVLELTRRVGEGLVYDDNAMAYAVYLHDWGAFPKYYQHGVDHALRSRQVAEHEILPMTTLPAATQLLIADAIEFHDYRDLRPAPSLESLILREADWLDMLGAIGIVREFAWGPNDLQRCYDRVLQRRAGIAGRFTLPASLALAEQRLAQMSAILRQLEEESFGIL